MVGASYEQLNKGYLSRLTRDQTRGPLVVSSDVVAQVILSLLEVFLVTLLSLAIQRQTQLSCLLCAVEGCPLVEEDNY